MPNRSLRALTCYYGKS